MRKAVGPLRFHTHLSHSGPPRDTPSAWTKQKGAIKSQAMQIAFMFLTDTKIARGSFLDFFPKLPPSQNANWLIVANCCISQWKCALTNFICRLRMMKADPGVMQLGQSVTQHGIGSPALREELGISDFRKYSWKWQEVDLWEGGYTEGDWGYRTMMRKWIMTKHETNHYHTIKKACQNKEEEEDCCQEEPWEKEKHAACVINLMFSQEHWM